VSFVFPAGQPVLSKNALDAPVYLTVSPGRGEGKCNYMYEIGFLPANLPLFTQRSD